MKPTTRAILRDSSREAAVLCLAAAIIIAAFSIAFTIVGVVARSVPLIYASVMTLIIGFIILMFIVDGVEP